MPADPINLDDALAAPDEFVAGMSESRSYSLFVPLPMGEVFRLLERHAFCPHDCVVTPYTLMSVYGSLVTTGREEIHGLLLDTFHNHTGE